MDYDAFIDKYKKYHNYDNLNNNNIIIKNDNNPFININCKNLTNKLYFIWAHKAPINEKMISRQILENWFDKYNWKSIDYEFNKNYYNLNETSSLWDIYFSSFSVQTFSKNTI